jgi:TM2 domain-containing membrane protein YozV
MKKILFIVFLLTGIAHSFAQDVTYEKVKQLFDSFDYDNLIKTSNQLLAKGNLNDSLIIEIHIMRAVSFYADGNQDQTKKSFENILAIKRNFSLDPLKISPKLVSLFEEVKTMFYRNNPETSALIDSTGIKQNIKNLDPNTIRIAVVQNLFLPGLGQLYQGKKIKGWIFAAASSLTFGGMIYFIFDSKTKENDYLKETNQFLIQQKYDVYNKSYKIRNAIIFSYALIWIYSQVDILLFHDSQVSTETTINGNYFGLNSMNRDFQLNFQIRF